MNYWDNNLEHLIKTQELHAVTANSSKTRYVTKLIKIINEL